MKLGLIRLTLAVASMFFNLNGNADCLATSITAVKNAPHAFDGTNIAVGERFIFSPHGMGIFDLENSNSGFRLDIPKKIWRLPIVDVLHINLFKTELSFGKEKITGVFCGQYDGQRNVLTLINMQRLKIEMPN
ncbi:MAG TPA: hypothetical protein VFN13_02910 [Rudaea sp.]|nr:hypothetical protein [Rudaea sp.]